MFVVIDLLVTALINASVYNSTLDVRPTRPLFEENGAAALCSPQCITFLKILASFLFRYQHLLLQPPRTRDVPPDREVVFFPQRSHTDGIGVWPNMERKKKFNAAVCVCREGLCFLVWLCVMCKSCEHVMYFEDQLP